jgi:beta-glucosidase/6-phospho-beta-glucosidase/beta-galactosidase
MGHRLVLTLLPLSLTLACPPTEPDPVDAGPSGTGALTFPDEFAFGTVISQWTTEGDQGAAGPVDSNWSRWAAQGGIENEQTNTDGNGFRTVFAADVQRAADLGLTHFRLGIDWSRVEPMPEVYDDAELDHLDDVIDAINAAGLQPVLTLYDWVVPTWVQNPDSSAPGGRVDLFADESQREYLLTRWEAFVERVVGRVKDRVDIYTVLNEPVTLVSAAYIAGEQPPGRLLDLSSAVRFGVTVAHMQARAYDAIHALDDVDADDNGDDAFVGLTLRGSTFRPVPADDPDMAFAAESISYVFHDWFLNAIVNGDLDIDLDMETDNTTTSPPEGHYTELEGRADFIGLQYSGPAVVKPDLILGQFHPLYGLPVYNVDDYDPTLPHGGTGLEVSGAALRETLDLFAQWGLPLYVSDNGTPRNKPPDRDATDDSTGAIDDDHGPFYMLEHLWEIGRAIEDGVDVRGWFHWTIADSFEWNDGRRQKFGAYSVDFTADDRARTLTPMGQAIGDVATARGIDAEIWNKWALDRYPSDQRDEGAGGTTTDPVEF